MAARAPCFIGVDVGTSGVRALAIDGETTPLAEGRAALPSPVQTRGAITQQPEIWWQAVVAALRDLLPRLPRHTPRTLAVDGTSGTLLAVDPRGQPLSPALMYNDAREHSLADRVSQAAPRTSAAHGATSAAAKALWFRRRYSRIHLLLHQADWILGRLLGEFRYSDENNVLKLGYDPVARQWPDWLTELGVDQSILPLPLEPGTPIGAIDTNAATAASLPQDLVLVAGTTDSTASFVATGARLPGEGVTALGSTLVVKILTELPLFAPEYGVYSQRLGDLWLAGGGSNSGGRVLLDHFTPSEMTRLTPELDPERATGLDYYPLPGVGERFPRNDPHLRSRISPIPGDRRIFFQGLLEGISQIENQAYQRLSQLGAPPVASIRTTGGGAGNPAWTHIRQRILHTPLVAARHTEAAYGTALLALTAAKEKERGDQ